MKHACKISLAKAYLESSWAGNVFAKLFHQEACAKRWELRRVQSDVVSVEMITVQSLNYNHFVNKLCKRGRSQKENIEKTIINDFVILIH